MNVINLTSKSDFIGATASTLCFLHCLATPLLFVAYSNAAIVEESHPWWWGILDIVFLVISFFAIYWTTKNTSKRWVQYTFWSLWALLAGIILNEKWEIMHLAEEIIYLPTLGLVFLHFYNRRYCQCEDEHCCTETKRPF